MPKLILTPHLQAQLLRFVRLFALSFLASGVLTAGSYGKDQFHK